MIYDVSFCCSTHRYLGFKVLQACQLKNVTSLGQKLPEPQRDATVQLSPVLLCPSDTGAHSSHLSYLE